MEMTSQ